MTCPELEPTSTPSSAREALQLKRQLEVQKSAKMANGHHPNENGGTRASSTAPGYTVPDRALGSPRHVRVVTIGAGASGLNMIRTLRRTLRAGSFEHVVYEKNEGVGGTWHESRYPGCRCDIPSHNYQFSWRKKTDWTNFCAPAREIEEYLCQVCEEEGMAGDIKLRHRVVGTRWDEMRGVWCLRVQNLASGEEFADEAHFVVDATGILNHWKWPDVPSMHDFQGKLVHSANWPEDLDYRSKTVAVIGNGSSGVQIVPAMTPDVKQLVHFIRSPTWIVPPRVPTMKQGLCKDLISQIQMDEKDNFTAGQIEKFKRDPEFYQKFVKMTEKDVNSNFPIFLKDSPVQAWASSKCREFMTAMLGGDPTLCKALIPDFPLGCRRMTPGPGYLESLRSPNVKLVTDGIARFVPEGIETTTGEVIKLDVIICATGFNMSFRPRFPVVGRDGTNLQNRWDKETPKAYMSCAVPGMPNYFTILGPNAPIAHGSVFTLTEHISKYLASIIFKCQEEHISSIVPQPQAVEEYFEHVTRFMPRTTWSSPSCNSWFKNDTKEGPVTAVHPGSRIHFFHMLKRFRGEDFEYQYESEWVDGEGDGGKRRKLAKNRFAYLGNGYSTLELDPEADSTWYLDEEGF